MKKLDLETQRGINGGWCLRSNVLFSAIDHYINWNYIHTDYPRYKSGGWYYYY